MVDRGPYVPSDLPNIMASSDLGVVVPIWEDNAPQVVMEFLNYGIPILGTKMGGIPDFVHEGNGILFDPYDQTSIDVAINRIRSLDHSEIARLAQGAKRLKSPCEHGREMAMIYKRAVSNG